MTEAFAASTLGLLITDLTEVTTAALLSTLLQQSFESLIEGKELGKNFGKEFLVNLVLIGAAKVFEVVLIGRAAPSGATQLGKGVYRSFSAEGRPVYYIEKALMPESEAAVFKIAGPKPNQLAKYGNIRAELTQVQNALKSRGADPYLVENALRRLDAETLAYFEKNPGKLLEAAEKLPGSVKNFGKLAPGPKLAETQKYLYRSTFEEMIVAEETVVKGATSQEINVLDIIQPRYNKLVSNLNTQNKIVLGDLIKTTNSDEVSQELLMDLLLGSERSSIPGIIERFGLQNNQMEIEKLLRYIQNHNQSQIKFVSSISFINGINDLKMFDQVLNEGVVIDYLFRGTSTGFGGVGNQLAGVTSTSSDPIVATIFALNSDFLSGGKGVLKIASISELKGVNTTYPNIIAQLEMEVAVATEPQNFSLLVTKEIKVEEARIALKELGIELPISSQVRTPSDVEKLLLETRRLTPKEVNLFIKKIQK